MAEGPSPLDRSLERVAGLRRGAKPPVSDPQQMEGVRRAPGKLTIGVL